jgi:hypothetical protein
MNNTLTWATYKGLLIENVTDELFWHVNRHNNASMEYYGGDAYIADLHLPKRFVRLLPDHLKDEWRLIWNKISRTKHQRLEIHPKTLSDRWDEVVKTKTPEEFLEAIENNRPLFGHD